MIAGAQRVQHVVRARVWEFRGAAETAVFRVESLAHVRERVRDADDVKALIGHATTQIIDARAAARWKTPYSEDGGLIPSGRTMSPSISLR